MQDRSELEKKVGRNRILQRTSSNKKQIGGGGGVKRRIAGYRSELQTKGWERIAEDRSELETKRWEN